MSINLHSRQTANLDVALECHQIEHTRMQFVNLYAAPKKAFACRSMQIPTSRIPTAVGHDHCTWAPNQKHIYAFREMQG